MLVYSNKNKITTYLSLRRVMTRLEPPVYPPLLSSTFSAALPHCCCASMLSWYAVVVMCRPWRGMLSSSCVVLDVAYRRRRRRRVSHWLGTSSLCIVVVCCRYVLSSLTWHVVVVMCRCSWRGTSSGRSALSLCVVVLDVARRCASLMMMRPVGT